MKCVIVGLSQFGKLVAMGLGSSEYEVVVIDSNLDDLERIKNKVSLSICAEQATKEIFEEHGLTNANVLIASITTSFEQQVLLVALAKKLEIPRIIAFARSEEHKTVLEAVGATWVLLPDHEAAHFLVQRIALPTVERYIELHDGFAVVQTKVPKDLIGKRLEDLKLREKFQINLVGIATKRNAEATYDVYNPIPDPTTVFHEGDVLYLAGSELALVNLLEFD